MKRLVHSLLIPVAVCAACISAASCHTDTEVILEAKSFGGESASIITYSSGPLMGYSSVLVLRDRSGQMIFQTNLLQHRDAAGDARQEFASLEIHDGAAWLNAKGVHYHGTNRFAFR